MVFEHTPPNEKQHEPSFAVFLDYHNLRRACKAILSIDLHHTQHSEILLLFIKDILHDKGSVAFERLYADLSKENDDPGFSRALNVFKTFFTPCHTQSRHREKEEATELYIARDVYRLLWRTEDVDGFVFISGDFNFLPLIEDISSEGKTATIICADPHYKESTNSGYEFHLIEGSMFERINYEQYYPLFVKVIFYGEKKMIESNWDVYTTGHLASFIRENKNGKFPVLTLHEINECLGQMEKENMLKTFSTINEKGKSTKGILLNHSHPKVDSIVQKTRDRIFIPHQFENGK